MGDFQLAVDHHEQSILYAANAEFKSSAIVNLVLVKLKASSILTNEENENLIARLNEAQLLNPSDDNIEFTVGLIRDQMGQPEIALRRFQSILSRNPTHSLALMNVGNYYFRRGMYGKSSEYFERTLSSLPEYDKNRKVLAFNNLGQSYREQGLYNNALQSFIRAKDLQLVDGKLVVESSIQFYSLNNIYTIQGLLCKWKDYELYEQLIEDFLIEANSNSNAVILNNDVNLRSLVDPYTMSLMRFSSLSFDRMVCQSACAASPIFDHTAAAAVATVAPPTLRVGYLSFDWRDHPMGRLTSHLVVSHNQSRVHSLSFSYGNNDGSSIRQLIEEKSPEFIDLSRVRNDFDAAAVVASKQVDILVDITAHTYNGRINIAALKPAPIVINYLGFPGTTGCSGFDYSMVDRVVVPPEGAEVFSERLIYLPHSYQANNMPLTVLPCSEGRSECIKYHTLFSSESYFGTAKAAAELLHRKHQHENVLWICSFNANKKFEPLSFASWANILMRVPSSILILLDIPSDAREQLLLQCSYHGISHSRVLFIGRQAWTDHLHRSAACDLVLDTFVYGAHTTSSDVLWMHIPIVTLNSFGSGRMPSRVAGSILGSLVSPGDSSNPLNVLIADSVKEYEDMAVRILMRPSMLSKLHSSIAASSMKAPTFGRYQMEESIEKAFQAVHELRLMNLGLTLPHVILVPIEQSADGFFKAAMSELASSLQASRKECSELDKLASLWSCSVLGEGDTNLEAVQRAIAVAKRLLFSYPESAHASLWRQIAAISSEKPSPPSVDTLIALVQQVYPHRFDPDFANNHLQKLQQFIGRGLKIDAPTTLLAVLDTQASLSSDCELDLVFFQALSVNVFSHCDQCDLQSLLTMVDDVHRPVLERVIQLIPNALLPSRVYHSNVGFSDNIPIILSHILQNHAICAGDPYAVSSFAAANNFVGLTLSALALDFRFDLLQKFGIRLMDAAQDAHATDAIEFGYQVATLALVNNHQMHFVPPPTAEPTPSSATTVVFYCYEYGQAWWPGWGPSSIAAGKALGGSEEAVYQTAVELSMLGFSVTIYGEIPEQDIGVVTHQHQSGGRVRWLHHTNLDLSQPCDVFIAWRYSLSLSFGKITAKRSYLWLHDLVPGNVLPQSVFTDYNGVLVQSSFHKQHILLEVAKFSHANVDVSHLISNKIYIVHNGVTLPSEDFAMQPLQNDDNVFIYGSAPNRGLNLVLHAWPLIKQAIPEARLEVYYGFTDAVIKYMKGTMGEEAFTKWHDHVMLLLQQDGVHYHGPVDPDALLLAYQRAGFWLYPTLFQETGCITGIKAMASGAIPITSRLQESVLIELTDKFDLGPSTPLNLTTAGSTQLLVNWLSTEFVPAVVRAHNFTKEQLNGHRVVMRYEVSHEYTWRNTALKLSALFNRDLSV